MKLGDGMACGAPPPVSNVLMSVLFWADKFMLQIKEKQAQHARRAVEQENVNMNGRGGALQWRVVVFVAEHATFGRVA